MKNLSTVFGGPGHGVFPTTRWTILRDAVDPDSPTVRDSLERFAALYWRPVYAYLRRKWGKSNEEAKDLTQEFFLAFYEKGTLGTLSPERGHFRAYVKGALDNFVKMDHRSRTAVKRGGGVPHLSVEVGDEYEPSYEDQPDRVFVQEWAGAILDAAMADLERACTEEGHEVHFRLFLRHEIEHPEGEIPGYDALAGEFGLSVIEVRNTLYRLRNRLRDFVFERVRETAESEEAARDEMKELFGGQAR